MEATTSNKRNDILKQNIEFANLHKHSTFQVDNQLIAGGLATIKAINEDKETVTLLSKDKKHQRTVSLLQLHNIVIAIDAVNQQTADTLNLDKKAGNNIRKGLKANLSLKANSSSKTVQKRTYDTLAKLSDLEFFVTKYMKHTLPLDNKMVAGGWGKLISYDKDNKLIEVVTSNTQTKFHVQFSIFALQDMIETGKAQYKAWKNEQKQKLSQAF